MVANVIFGIEQGILFLFFHSKHTQSLLIFQKYKRKNCLEVDLKSFDYQQGNTLGMSFKIIIIQVDDFRSYAIKVLGFVDSTIYSKCLDSNIYV